ncbi:hypothetical protein BH09VER1_BH09VER1_38550 [soil metagenome]
MSGPHRYLLFVLCTVLPVSGASALDRVVLQLKWHHQFQFAGYYAAIAKGYYREAGLDVELREAQPGHDPIDEVIDGHAQFGVGTSNLVLLRGQNKPVVVLAVIYQHSPFVLLASNAKKIRDIHDLASQPIMMEPDAGELLAYFKNEGVDPAKLQLMPHSFDVKDLVSGKIGAMSAYSTDEPFHLKQAGIPYLIFTPRAGGIDFYGDNLFTTEQQIHDHPERVKAFLNASLRGWVYAMSHQEEMVDLILKDYNRGKTRAQLLFEAEETAKLVHPELIELGYINPGRWENIAQTYADLGMLPHHFSLKGFIYSKNGWPDLRWFYWTAGIFASIACGALIWMLHVARVNRHLQHEIEARKRAEEKAHSESEAKTRFLAILAHEVRSPLSGILSSLWLYQRSDSEKERRDVVGIAETSAENLLQMVDNILDHSKLETGNMAVERLVIGLPGFLGEICDLFRASANAKGITIRCEIAPNVPPTIKSDPVKVRQILSNLLSNAVKFTPAGSVAVQVEAEFQKDTSTLISFRVTDTGPGIPREHFNRIFQPYAQGDITVSRQYGGTGLGLSISSQLARLLGGEITVESEPPHGATFILTIPVDHATAPA